MKKILIICTYIFTYSALNAQITPVDTIKQVEITVDKSGTENDVAGAKLVQVMNENEFKKAACCTLSESFELSNTVEVSNADGVSGIRQIEMLGLNGKYVLMTRDNIPQINGLATLNGLSNIPGSFVSEVKISKGTGSVTLGYEGTTGGINYALKTNPKDPKFHFNLYQNNQSRSEVNSSFKFKRKGFQNVSFLHGGIQTNVTDMNHDGYSDMPKTNRIYLANHSSFQNDKTENVVGFTYWNDNKIAGSTRFHGSNELNGNLNAFKFSSDESRLDVYAKIGILPGENSETSFGNIFNVSNHLMNYVLNSNLNRTYLASENRFQYTGLRQGEVNEHMINKSGISVHLSQFDETFKDSFNEHKFNYNEMEFGLFSEWSALYDKSTFVFGIRADYHNFYCLFVTPRFHYKYEHNKNNTFFFQSGLGRRTAYVLAENLPIFISNRELILKGNTDKGPYGFGQEVAGNFGMSYLKKFMFFHYPSSLSFDVFHTRFIHQINIDRDAEIDKVILVSNQNKNAGFNNSFFVEWNMIPFRRVELKFAYRYVNNQQFLDGKLQMAPFQSIHRGLITLNYQTRNKWYFDLVGQINGKKRIPYFSKSDLYDNYSPNYFIINTQIRKVFKNKFEIYTGVENLFNRMQMVDLVLDRRLENKQIFDAAYSWGPSNGRLIYFGIRYNLN
jgi:hypothetical protein